MLRVSHVFVSHTHLDHFFGFDLLLRLLLHRPKILHLTGPTGIIAQVAAKLGGYTWNLLGEDSPDFRLRVAEFEGEGLARAAVFRARDAFRPRQTSPAPLPPGLALETDDFRIEAAVLDHGIPCLAFSLRERLRVNVRKEALAELGLEVGPWLNGAKRAIRRGDPDDTAVPVGRGLTLPLGRLRERAFRVGPGQSVAYATDCAHTDANVAKILALARDVDQLFIEAVFLDEDAGLAAERKHLTAGQAGRIARAAGARRLVPFHFSPRYLDRPDALPHEAGAAFDQ